MGSLHADYQNWRLTSLQLKYEPLRMATDACIGPCCFLGESTAAGTNDYLHILETTLQPPDTYVKLAYEKDSLTVLCLVEAIQISCTSNIRSHSQPFNFSNSPLAMQLLQYQKILPTCPHHTATPHNSSKFSIRFWQEQSLAFFFVCTHKHNTLKRYHELYPFLFPQIACSFTLNST